MTKAALEDLFVPPPLPVTNEVPECCEDKTKAPPALSTLRVKIKSLAAEARIIRHEERLHPGPSDMRSSLHQHRVIVVRDESRASHLLHMYAKWLYERSKNFSSDRCVYSRVEPNCRPDSWGRTVAIHKAKAMGSRFGVDTERFDEWTAT